MRLISQDGMIDVPYEQASIEIDGNDIYCGYSSIITRRCTGRCFAEYSSKAKALKVMEMVRNAYTQLEITRIIACGSSEYIAKSTTLEEANDIISNFWKMATFQFPKDEDVEV